MPVIVLVGAQWGDEGKGKATDLLGDRIDYVVKFNGGNNAGHTVVIKGEKYALHLSTIAEGIEDAGQLSELTDGNCELGQGYYFAEPLTDTDMGELLFPTA